MYTLQVNFTPNQLDKIYDRNKKVVLVKESAQRGDLALAWVAFNPLEENTITWDTDFSVYASKTAIQNGAQVKLMSNRDATKGYLYKFDHGHFSQEDHTRPGAYCLHHAMKDFRTTTFGLAQVVSINGENIKSPINAIAADYNDQITLVPVEKVRIFLQSSIDNGTVISAVNETTNIFDFTRENSLAAKYDSDKKIFLNDTFEESL